MVQLIQLGTMRLRVRSLALLSGLRIWHCCGVGPRHGSDPALLWLWRRPVATAPIRPLAWEPPYAMGAAQEKAKRPKKRKKKRILRSNMLWESKRKCLGVFHGEWAGVILLKIV